MANDDLPVVLGGRPAVTTGAAAQAAANQWPVVTADDEAAVLAALHGDDWSGRVVTDALEADYRAYFGVRHAVAHCNGTAALLAAFFGLDLRPGDEAIVPSATWWSSASPLLWVGAVPVFAEIDPLNGGLDPADVERRVTPRTRAIVVVHLWGNPARTDELRAVAKRHHLAIVEDASHASGAVDRGRKIGSLGDVAVISLQSQKLAPAGEGGMLLTDRDDVAERVALLGDVRRIYELPTTAKRFAATSFGMKTRLGEIPAALARSQFAKLDERNGRRSANVERLGRTLDRLGFHTFRPTSADVTRVHFENLVRVPDGLPCDPATLANALKAEGCDVRRPRYPLLHQQPFFTEGHAAKLARLPAGVAAPVYRPDALPVTEAAATRALWLPAFPWAEPALLDEYAAAFEKVMRHADRLPAG